MVNNLFIVVVSQAAAFLCGFKPWASGKNRAAVSPEGGENWTAVSQGEDVHRTVLLAAVVPLVPQQVPQFEIVL